uniref:RING-type E3 ubiquitin transferase n=1 Tax=Saccoglossus kowalevskii TaxID=10224 RepID=A0ABM0MQ21_SACKO|nr:PREDICTED: E3 ubiquitin-protein ligase MARCH4-like [Saccoglossus kowalevskii]
MSDTQSNLNESNRHFSNHSPPVPTQNVPHCSAVGSPSIVETDTTNIAGREMKPECEPSLAAVDIKYHSQTIYSPQHDVGYAREHQTVEADASSLEDVPNHRRISNGVEGTRCGTMETACERQRGQALKISKNSGTVCVSVNDVYREEHDEERSYTDMDQNACYASVVVVSLETENSPAPESLQSKNVLQHTQTAFCIGDDVLSFSSSGTSTREMCRICCGGRDTGELMSPCMCAGSVEFCHKDCLRKWISCQGCYRCEICHDKYMVHTKIPANLNKWKSVKLTGAERLHIAVFVLTISFLVCTLTWISWSALSNDPDAIYERSTVAGRVSYTIYVPMDMLSFCIIALEIRFVLYKIWRRWLSINADISVISAHQRFKDEQRQKEETVTNVQLTGNFSRDYVNVTIVSMDEDEPTAERDAELNINRERKQTC